MKEKMFKTIVSFKNVIDERLNNERGYGVVMSILFTGILVLAVIAMQTDVEGTFTSIATKFKTWIENKVDSVMTTS